MHGEDPAAVHGLIDECVVRAVELLLRNLTPSGMLAATPGPEASERGYLAVFGRDAAVCAIGMALSGDATLEREAPTGLVTLAQYQARNGQIPKFVDVNRADADFWYLYTNALWYVVKQQYGLLRAGETRRNFNQLFHPFSARTAEYRRARLLTHYVRNRARHRDLYLSHGRTYELCGMPGQSWNAAAFLIARHALACQRPLFATRPRRRHHRNPTGSASSRLR